jgi:hypothetical protein
MPGDYVAEFRPEDKVDGSGSARPKGPSDGSGTRSRSGASVATSMGCGPSVTRVRSRSGFRSSKANVMVAPVSVQHAS